jgi:hypothetical protein
MTTVRSVLLCNESVVCAELDGEAVLLNVESGLYFGMDAVGTQIWGLLTQGATEEEITARILEEYEATPEQVRADLIEFLGLLQEKGLITVAGER